MPTAAHARDDASTVFGTWDGLGPGGICTSSRLLARGSRRAPGGGPELVPGGGELGAGAVVVAEGDVEETLLGVAFAGLGWAVGGEQGAPGFDAGEVVHVAEAGDGAEERRSVGASSGRGATFATRRRRVMLASVLALRSSRSSWYLPMTSLSVTPRARALRLWMPELAHFDAQSDSRSRSPVRAGWPTSSLEASTQALRVPR